MFVGGGTRESAAAKLARPARLDARGLLEKVGAAKVHLVFHAVHLAVGGL